MCDYRPPKCTTCSTKMRRVVTTATVNIWNAERKFPNVGNRGDGSMSFSSKAAYESHLTANHMAESATDGKVKRPHAAEVTVY